jgi:predicted DNA-binding protein with PD1-like motif
MQTKLIHNGPQRTFAIVLETGDEVIQCLNTVAKDNQLSASQFTGLGAFSDVVLGYFSWSEKDYREIPIDEQVEVLNLTGDVTLSEGEPRLHPHVVLGKADGSAHGGHLLRAHVRPTLEIVLTESPAHLVRRHDPESGLPLIQL